jgi:hypothetical protein
MVRFRFGDQTLGESNEERLIDSRGCKLGLLAITLKSVCVISSAGKRVVFSFFQPQTGFSSFLEEGQLLLVLLISFFNMDIHIDTNINWMCP